MVDKIYNFYFDLISCNSVWVKRASIWAGFWFLSGLAVYILRPDLIEQVLNYLQRVFGDALGEEGIASLNWNSVMLIWEKNVIAALLSMFLGIVAGLVSLLTLASNFFILGFIFGFLVIGQGIQESLGGFLTFGATIIPHAVFEIPALIFASAFGLKLGLSFTNYKQNLKEVVLLAPFLIVLLLAAAVVEVFVTGNLARLILD